MSGPTSHSESLASADATVVYGALAFIRDRLRAQAAILTPTQEAVFSDENEVKALAAQVAKANAATQVITTKNQQSPSLEIFTPRGVLTHLIHPGGLISGEEYDKLHPTTKSLLASTDVTNVRLSLAVIAGALGDSRKSLTEGQHAVLLNVGPGELAEKIAQMNIDPHDMTYLTGAVIMSQAVQQEAGSLASYQEAAATIQVGSLSGGTTPPGTDSSAENFTFLTEMSDRTTAGVHTTAVLGASGAGKSIFCARGLRPQIRLPKNAPPQAVYLTVMMRCHEVVFEDQGLCRFILSLLQHYVARQKEACAHS